MRVFCLSPSAGRALLSHNIEFAAIDPGELQAKLILDSESVIVVGEIPQIDNEVADKIEEAAAAGISVGIVPYDFRYPDSFARLLSSSEGVREPDSTIGLYSSRGLDFDFREPDAPFAGNIVKLRRRSEDQGRITSPDDAALQITRHDFTALAVVTEGRQTYCLMGMGCLHPTISAPELGRVSPRDVRARHWLLQSCHSPFMWPELGSYLTLPLSIALTGGAETVICSTHVQTYVPDLLNLYMDLTTAGTPMGEVVRALNAHAASEGVDFRPFMLLGNPASRAIVSGSARPKPIVASAQRTLAKERLELLRRLVANVSFVSDASNFGLEKKNDAHSQFCRDMAWLPRVDIRLQSRLAAHSDDLGALIDGIRPSSERISLKTATERLSEAWERAGGFYAVGEQLDEWYNPEGAGQTKSRCQICRGKLLERKLAYFGQSASADYAERRQIYCSRCLVAEHINPAHRSSTEITAERLPNELVVRLCYTNKTSQPQWVYAFAFLSDPKNISKSTAGDAYKALLEKTVNRRSQQCPRSIAPGESFEFEHRTGSVPEDFWYLLLEVNLMVDFCWNWFSFTFRESKIEAWLSSDEYPSTLPRVKVGTASNS
jgi:hypothetical protein